MAEVKIDKVVKPGHLHHYCKFSRVGDICIKKKGMSLVVDTGLDEQDISLSPRYEDKDGCITSLTIEGKRGNVDLDSLMYQLFTNTMLTFYRELQQSE